MGGIGLCLAASPERRHVLISDSDVRERGRQRLGTEVRVPPRAWLRTNVRKRLDIGLAQGRDELLEGSRAVTNRPNVHEISVEGQGYGGPTIR